MNAQQSWWSRHQFRMAFFSLVLLGGGVAACGGPTETGDSDPEVASDGGVALNGDPATDAGSTHDSGQTSQDAGQGTVDAGATCTSDTWANYGQQFFANTCVGCHSWASSYSSVKSDLSSIKSRISSGSMPKGVTLSSAEKARLIEWMDCGAPQ